MSNLPLLAPHQFANPRSCTTSLKLPTDSAKRCYNKPIRRLKIIDMENVKDIAFNADGSIVVTLNDETVTTYVPSTAAPAAPTQTVALAAGETLLVTAA
jgi:hypothetical protein